MTDPLGDLLRAADPGTVQPGDPLTERGQKQLAHYKALEEELASERSIVTTLSPKRRRISRRFALGGVAAAMFLAVVVALFTMNPAPAYALTPPMLEMSEVDGDASAMLEKLADLRLQHEAESRVIRAQTWELSISYAEDESIEFSIVEPRWHEISFEEDGTVHQRVIAAEPFPGQESDVLSPPGTIIVDETVAHEDWYGSIVGVPPRDADAIGDYLADLYGESELTSGEILGALSSVLLFQPLSSEQEAAVLSYLASTEGFTVAGDVTDRLGREGIAFKANDSVPGDFESVLIVSSVDGAILAYEEIYVGPPLPEITAPSVTSYTAWE